MVFDRIKSGRIIVEIRVLNPEKLLNILWSRGISIYRVKKRNITTFKLEINYLNYGEVFEVVQNNGGKIKVVKGVGFIFFLGKLKKRISLVVGAVIFIFVLFYLSNFIWSIEIDVQKNISPYEIRQELKAIGIVPGVSKSNIKVTSIEKKLENINSEILWLRVRIEGSTLKVYIQEKINPPSQWQGNYGNLVAVMQGEVKRVYTYDGKSIVEPGAIVKVGEVLIKGVDGMEGQEYLIQPRGMVIANTFYEKEMQVKLQGNKLERSGEKDSELFIKIFGKKIYLKKAIKGFVHYDKIEKGGKIFNEVLYYERVEKKINTTEEQATNMAITELEKSLVSGLTRDAKVVDKIVTKQLDSEGNFSVKIVFVVEQNIVNDVPVAY